jgi:protoheme IX farnesyltransferase
MSLVNVAPASPQGSRLKRFLFAVSARWPALAELTKPRIVTMVLVAAGVGFLAGSHLSISPLRFILTMTGTCCFAASASVLNQVMEQSRDALMRRTSNRPLPSGRISRPEAILWGTFLLALGSLILLSGSLYESFKWAGLTWLLYLGAYTPLKPVSSVNTIVGAIPGALPPVIGWAGATGSVGLEAFSLFLILFLWQFPHFLAIAWMYRDDYRRGGYRMITADDTTGYLTALQAVGYAAVLVPVSLLPFQIRMAGFVYFAAALLLSFYYLIKALEFLRDRNDKTARRMLFASLWYLPLVYLFLILNPLPA